ncbi:MAG: hypothetical protein H2044_13585 [Rhizobiales bacterium]|nr:hypothetical protein [Hyphomicrobiales bacterium]
MEQVGSRLRSSATNRMGAAMEEKVENVVPLEEITARLSALAEQARALCKDLEPVADEDDEDVDPNI